MNRPQVLKKGDKVAIVSLSSGILGESFCKHQVLLGVKRLRKLGLEPVFMQHALKGLAFIKENPSARAQDLKQAFFDDEIKGIICVIGGDDTYRIVPYLMEDQAFIEQVAKNPKLFTGFSDTTIDHLMFYKLGMQTYYGPNFLCDLAELSDEMLPYTMETFKGYFQEGIKTITSSPVWYEERTEFGEDQVGKQRICHKERRGYELLQGSGKFSGKLLGGCLESLYDMLTQERYEDEPAVCEQYGLFPTKEEWQDKLLFIETCEEKPTPEQLEKELLVLKKKGVFDVISGILVGKPQDEAYYEAYKAVYTKVIDNKALPIVYNVNFGHASPRCALLYGAQAEVDMEKGTISYQ